MIIFATTLYIDYKDHPSYTPFAILLCYGFAIVIAGMWSIINYINHIKIHAMYRKDHDLASFVERLAMDKDEKAELLAYMEDFKADLIEQGKSSEEAAKIALHHFTMQEFEKLAKDSTIFKLPAHYYLWGYTALLAVVFIFTLILVNLWTSPVIMVVIEATSFAYAFGFATVFFMYKVIDMMIYKKL